MYKPFLGKWFDCAQCNKEKIFTDFHSSQKRRIATGHRKGVRCKDCLCRECKSCRKREPPKRGGTSSKGDEDVGDYYCMACPHQRCIACQTMKPLAAFPTQSQGAADGSRTVRPNRATCAQCTSKLWKCEECRIEKERSAFVKFAKEGNRCKDCQFPKCQECQREREVIEGNVKTRYKIPATGQDGNVVYHWYCAKELCQSKKQEAHTATCPECHTEQEKKEFIKSTCEAMRCKACSYPICSHCGHKRKVDEGYVKLHDKISIGDGRETKYLWYCADDRCQVQTPLKCDECNLLKKRSSFGKTSKNVRCQDCLYPTCACCGCKRKEADGCGQRSDKITVTGPTGVEERRWYCGLAY